METVKPLTNAQRTDALKLAQKYKRDQAQQIADYAADCAQDRAEGYRPHYCIHGVNMWVDYDCACYMCEEYGNYLNPQEPYYRAIAEVRANDDRRTRILQAIFLLDREGVFPSIEQYVDLVTRGVDMTTIKH